VRVQCMCTEDLQWTEQSSAVFSDD